MGEFDTDFIVCKPVAQDIKGGKIGTHGVVMGDEYAGIVSVKKVASEPADCLVNIDACSGFGNVVFRDFYVFTSQQATRTRVGQIDDGSGHRGVDDFYSCPERINVGCFDIDLIDYRTDSGAAMPELPACKCFAMSCQKVGPECRLKCASGDDGAFIW